jgi:hypothetical protein
MNESIPVSPKNRSGYQKEDHRDLFMGKMHEPIFYPLVMKTAQGLVAIAQRRRLNWYSFYAPISRQELFDIIIESQGLREHHGLLLIAKLSMKLFYWVAEQYYNVGAW